MIRVLGEGLALEWNLIEKTLDEILGRESAELHPMTQEGLGVLRDISKKIKDGAVPVSEIRIIPMNLVLLIATFINELPAGAKKKKLLGSLFGELLSVVLTECDRILKAKKTELIKEGSLPKASSLVENFGGLAADREPNWVRRLFSETKSSKPWSYPCWSVIELWRGSRILRQIDKGNDAPFEAQESGSPFFALQNLIGAAHNFGLDAITAD